MEQSTYHELAEIVSKERIKIEEPMSSHTTFRVGGPAELFVMPGTFDEVRGTVEFCRKNRVPYYIVGNGSNLLVSDEGYQGVIIQLGKELGEIRIEGDSVTAQAGARLSVIANQAMEADLTGFEFASGIPGTLGGACVMNAGAYGGEMRDVLTEITALTPEGDVIRIPKEQMELGYRTSIVSRKEYIVLEACMQLKKGNRQEIQAQMEELREKRVSKQPLEYPSAGSTFKRPEGYFAGKLIQDAGLRGFTVGGAQVSEKHCGFVINRGGATAKDVAKLMSRVSEIVEEKFGVKLEPEVKRLGVF
ncbi:UDP-N-acetylenolpyruvoylglucosamine reductase [Lachnospiraceae bacterium]|nr:UDP-N-acetylenolpyruvoylglucosamine reductase [Lachnospiraceae bacterium]